MGGQIITEEKRKQYIADVHAEMSRRGLSKNEIERVISKTGFYKAMELCAEEQMHYAVTDAVNEIIFVAALN